MAKKVKTERLELREALLKEAAELSARARTLRVEIDQIEAEALADIQATGKASCKRGEFLLALAEKSGSVSWKNEFIRVASAEAAAELAAAVEKKPIVKITALTKVA